MKVQKQKWFYEIEGIEFIWNGAQSEPQVKYKEKLFNYYELEDALYSMYDEDRDILDNFLVWIKKNEHSATDFLDDLIELRY